MEMRRASLHTLRDFGMGKKALEDMIEEEVANFLIYMENRHSNHPVDVRRMFNVSSLSSLWKMISGESLPLGDVKLEFLIQKLQELVVEVSNPLIQSSLNNLLLFRLLNLFGISHQEKIWKELNDFCDDVVKTNKLKNALDDNCPLSFTEAMLSKISHSQEESAVFHKELGELNLRSILTDFFIAGSDTTSNTLNWSSKTLTFNVYIGR